MPYPEEFPHQVLGLGRSFTDEEREAAVLKAIKRTKNLAKIQAYNKELSDRGKRLEYESLIPYGGTELEQRLELQTEGLCRGTLLPDVAQALPVTEIGAYLENDADTGFTIDKCEPPEVTLSTGFDMAGSTAFPIVFDK